MPIMVDAYCAGTPVTVAIHPRPMDIRRVACPSCGAKPHAECKDIDTGQVFYTGHGSRHARAERQHHEENR